MISRILSRFFSCVVYVKVSENRISVREITRGSNPKSAEVRAEFTTQRLLVGQFVVAEAALTSAFRKVITGFRLSANPVVVIHPMAKIEGGLSEVEERVLKEISFASGARKVVVWVGAELTDDQVRALAGSKAPSRVRTEATPSNRGLGLKPWQLAAIDLFLAGVLVYYVIGAIRGELHLIGLGGVTVVRGLAAWVACLFPLSMMAYSRSLAVAPDDSGWGNPLTYASLIVGVGSLLLAGSL